MSTKVVSYSELDALRQCPLKHHLAYTERWKPSTTAPALARGTLFHQVMDAHYRQIRSARLSQSTVDEFVDPRELLRDGSEQAELVKWVYEGYVEEYGIDPEWEILEVEYPLEAWLPGTKGRSSFKMKGKIDLLVRDHSAGGGLWFVDHKTCRNLPKGKELDFDDQFGIYTYLGRQNGLDIQGAIHNACRTEKLKRPMTSDERFRRSLTVRTDTELKTMAQEALATFRRGLLAGSREGVALPPRAPDPDRCGWRCPFTEPCLMSRKGVELHPLLDDMGFVQDFTRH